MSDLNQFERLAKAARTERAPRIDVAARVAASVDAFECRRGSLRAAGYLGMGADSPLLAFAGLSLAAALLVGMFALPCWESLEDPLVAFCKPLSAIFE
ncbi:MAG TPA: hypothetical protein PK867_21125 [Pirellulales bacterium]|nr:hypothetical protein [Pirellulales bacterium]